MDVKMPRDEAGARSEEMRQPDEVAEMQQSIEQRGGECRVIGVRWPKQSRHLSIVLNVRRGA